MYSSLRVGKSAWPDGVPHLELFLQTDWEHYTSRSLTIHMELMLETDAIIDQVSIACMEDLHVTCLRTQPDNALKVMATTYSQIFCDVR